MHSTAVPEFPSRDESVLAHVGARAPGDSRGEHPNALHLAVSGLSAAEIGVLQSILAVLEDRTDRPWRLSDEASADLHLHTREAGLGATLGIVTGVILREGDVPAPPDQVSITLPLRVMSVMDALNAAQDRLNRRRHAEPAADEALVLHADDGKALAAALARLTQRRSEQDVRVRIVGHGTLFLCPIQRIYCIDFPRERLCAALEQHRYVITTLAHDTPELAAQLPFARPIDEVLWRVGLLTPWGRDHEQPPRFGLRRWPDLARLPHRAEHIQLCAALAAQPRSVDELVAMSGLGRSDVMHWLHACELCGLLQASSAEENPSRAPTPPAASGLGGLFDRLRRKLGF